MDIRARSSQPQRGLTGAAPQAGAPRLTVHASTSVTTRSQPVPKSGDELTSATRVPTALQPLKPETKATSSSTGSGFLAWSGGGITIKKLLVLALLTTGRGGFASALPHGTKPVWHDIGGDRDDGLIGERDPEFTPIRYGDPKARSGSVRAVRHGYREDGFMGHVTALHELVVALRTSGIRKIVVGEKPAQPINLFTNVEIIKGAASVGPVTLYHGSSLLPAYQDEYEDGLYQLDGKTVDTFIENDLCSGFEADPVTVKSLKDTIASGQLSIRPMFLSEPGRLDFRNFLSDDAFSVATVPLPFAVCSAAGQGTRIDCPSGPAYMTGMGNLSAEKFKQSLDFFARAHAKGLPTILVMPRSAPGRWKELYDQALRSIFTAIDENLPSSVASVLSAPPLFSRAEVHQHFLDQGFVLLEVPLADAENVTIVAPGNMLQVLKDVAAKYRLNACLFYSDISRSPGDQSLEASPTSPVQTKSSHVDEL